MIQMNQDEWTVACAIGQRRYNISGSGDNYAVETGWLEQHQAAVLAEMALSKKLNLYWTGCGIGKGHERADVGGLYEVRSITAKKRRLIIRDDDPERPTFLVYVDVERLRCTILGWQWPSVVREIGEHRPATDGGRECWFLDQGDLR